MVGDQYINIVYNQGVGTISHTLFTTKVGDHLTNRTFSTTEFGGHLINIVYILVPATTKVGRQPFQKHQKIVYSKYGKGNHLINIIHSEGGDHLMYIVHCEGGDHLMYIVHSEGGDHLKYIVIECQQLLTVFIRASTPFSQKKHHLTPPDISMEEN